MIGKIKDLLARKPGTFRIGDMVVQRDGTGYPMLVTEIQKTRHMQEPLVYCRWFDRQTKETRFNFFPESKLMPFDWSTRADE